MKRALLLSSLTISSLIYAMEPKIIYEEDPTLLITNIEVVVTSGAADDDPKKAGISSLMSELMLRGTKKKSRTKFQNELEQMGASMGVRASPDGIVFEAKVIKEKTADLLALLNECLTEPAFKETEFNALKREQIAEVNHRKNNNGRLAGLAARREAFAGTPLERSVEGGLDSLKKLKLDDVKRAYNDKFHQGNLVFGVSSALPEAEIKKALTAAWSKLPDGLRKAPKSIPPQIPQKPVLVVVQKADTSTGNIIMAQTGITAQDDKRFALAVANFGFGGEPLVSRLFKVIRGELGWTYQIGSTYNAMGGLSSQQGLFIISTTPTIEFSAKSILKAISMWTEFLQNGLKAEELMLAKESLVNSYPFEFDSAEKRLSAKMYAYLNNIPMLSPEEYAKKINGISLKDAQEALKKQHTANGWLITIAADAKVIEKQLAEEQKEVPEADRIKISKVIKPEQVIN